MGTKNKPVATINKLDNALVEEALDAITQEVTEDLTVKPNAFYLPSNERTEKENLEIVVSSLESSIAAKQLNSKNGKRASYEEDDLMEYINDAEVFRAIELKNRPYFARINYAENGESLGKVLYIGEENIANIISWKEPIAQLYYKKPFHEKIEIDQKQVELDMIRELTIEQGQLKKLHPEQRKVLAVDPQLVEKLAAKKGAQMNALIDSLQAEQYEMIQLPITQPIVVQGSAGSGKSVIALHRLSYILYNHKQLEANRIAIIGPNKLFLNHIKNVLPKLDNGDIVQTTLQQDLEARLQLTNKVQQVDRLILSEVLDLSVKEGRQQAEADFNVYAQMRELKGSLAYKDYIERYTEFIVADLSPFMKNVTYGPFTMSGIEMAQFVAQAPHFGESKEQLKQYVATTFKVRLQQFNQMMSTLATVIAQQVELFVQAVEEKELLSFTTPMIEQQKQLVKEQQQHVQRIKTYLNHRNYRQLLEASELEEIGLIESLAEREERAKELGNERVTAATQQLSVSKQELEQLIRLFVNEQIQSIVEKAPELIVLEKTAAHEIQIQLEHYCQLLHKPYIFAQATELLEQPGYVSAQQLNGFLQDLNTHMLTDLNASWAQQSANLIAEFNAKILQEITGHLVQRIEEVMLTPHENLKGIQLFMRHVHKHTTAFASEGTPDFVELFTEIDSFYKLSVEDIYTQIIHDQHEQAQNLAQGLQVERLAQYPEIGNYDLPALYSIHKLITPTVAKPLQYAIIDEAQDYSLFEMAVLQDLTEQIMLMGDLGQNISPGNSLNSWQQFEEVIGPFCYYELKATFRSTRPIVDFANKIIKAYSDGKYSLPQIAFRNGEKVEQISRSGQGVYTSMREVIEQLLTESAEEARTAIIAKTVREARLVYEQLNHPAVKLQLDTESVDAKVVITTPVLAKGLEFDHVLLFRFNGYSKTDEYDSKLAYVAASRALHKLYVYS